MVGTGPVSRPGMMGSARSRPDIACRPQPACMSCIPNSFRQPPHSLISTSKVTQTFPYLQIFPHFFYIFFHFLTPPPPIQSHDANFRTPPPDSSPVKFSETYPKCHFWNIYSPQTPQFCPKVRPGHPKTPPSAPKFDLLITL